MPSVEAPEATPPVVATAVAPVAPSKGVVSDKAVSAIPIFSATSCAVFISISSRATSSNPSFACAADRSNSMYSAGSITPSEISIGTFASAVERACS